jgi:hypothetical protein
MHYAEFAEDEVSNFVRLTGIRTPRESMLTNCRVRLCCRRSRTMRTTSGRSSGRRLASRRRYVNHISVGSSLLTGCRPANSLLKSKAGKCEHGAGSLRNGSRMLLSIVHFVRCAFWWCCDAPCAAALSAWYCSVSKRGVIGVWAMVIKGTKKGQCACSHEMTSTLRPVLTMCLSGE